MSLNDPDSLRSTKPPEVRSPTLITKSFKCRRINLLVNQLKTNTLISDANFLQTKVKQNTCK